MLGMIGSVLKFNSDILMRLLALAFLADSGITTTNFAGLSTRMFYATFL
jgi:hypothetical protein